MKKISKKLSGLTLIELIVSVALLAVIIMSTSSIFRIVLANQRQSGLNQGLEDETAYFLEVFAREARGAQLSAGDCGVASGHLFAVTPAGDELDFKNAAGDCVSYYVADDNGRQRLRIDRGAASDYITSYRYQVAGLHFVLTDDLSSSQPLVTASLKLAAPDSAATPLSVETSVTPRYYE